jgi:acyl carrier protein
MTTITQKDILEILKELIINHDNGRLGTRYSDINLHSTLMGDLGFDSMDVAELTMAIESRLKIRIEDEEVEKIFMKENIERLMNFVYNRYKDSREKEF